MKASTFILSAIALSVITACTTTRSTDPFAPTKEMAKTSGTPIAQLGEGHAIYMRHCTQCHDSQIPRHIPNQAWHAIVPGMAWNAGLSAEETKAVNDYILAANPAPQK